MKASRPLIHAHSPRWGGVREMHRLDLLVRTSLQLSQVNTLNPDLNHGAIRVPTASFTIWDRLMIVR
jgi:hypothetical protein